MFVLMVYGKYHNNKINKLLFSYKWDENSFKSYRDARLGLMLSDYQSHSPPGANRAVRLSGGNSTPGSTFGDLRPIPKGPNFGSLLNKLSDL